MATYKDNQYRISVISATEFDIPVPVDPQVANSINRPADSSLGVYKPDIFANCTAGAPTIINSPIPHGLANGNQITISYVSTSLLSGILTTHTVTVLSPTQFSIPFDSTAVAGTF